MCIITLISANLMFFYIIKQNEKLKKCRNIYFVSFHFKYEVQMQ